MSKAWIKAKAPEFVRDIIRDFCLSWRVLEGQFSQFGRNGQVDFEVLRDLLGEEMNKGLLWRLKDTAHHLFRSKTGAAGLVGQFLDWSVGYIFHDAMKLKEDSYQQQNYAPWFRQLIREDLPEEEKAVSAELLGVLEQTSESMHREIERIRFIVAHCRRLFPLYLAAHRDNPLLARFLYDQDELVREVFGPDYPGLVGRIYGDRPDHMYLLAAMSLRQGGWIKESALAIARAVQLAPDSQSIRREERLIADRLAREAR